MKIFFLVGPWGGNGQGGVGVGGTRNLQEESIYGEGEEEM